MTLYQKIYHACGLFYKLRMYNNGTNELWFRGKDVALVLQYKKTTHAIEKYVDEAQKMPLNAFDTQPSKGLLHPLTIFINKDGLTKLCNHTGSSTAKTFLQWVEREEKNLQEKNLRVNGKQSSNDTKLQLEDDIEELLSFRVKNNQSSILNHTKEQWEDDIEELLYPRGKMNESSVLNDTNEQRENNINEEQHEEYMDNIEQQEDIKEQLENYAEEKQENNTEELREHTIDLNEVLNRINNQMINVDNRIKNVNNRMDDINEMKEEIRFIVSKIRKQNSKVASIPKDKRVQQHLKVYRKQMEDGRFKYRFLRPQERNLARSMKRVKGYRMVKAWKNVPNPIHVVNVLKEILRKQPGIKFTCHNNDIIVNVKIHKFIKRAFYKGRLFI